MAKFNEYPAKTIPKDADKFMLYSAEDSANKLIDYDKLADAVLDKLTSKQFTLDQGTKTLLSALNELNSKGKTAYITKPDNVNIHVISDDLATSIEWIYTIDDFSASNYSRIVFYKNGEVAAQSQFKGEWKTVKLVTRT